MDYHCSGSSSIHKPSDTKCPKCGAEYKIGFAIDTGNRKENNVCTGFGLPTISHEYLKLIHCLKCPKCGYSDDITEF